MRFVYLLFFISIISTIKSQNQVYVVEIGENALMCPNLGPKLQFNIKQMGVELLKFDKEESEMWVRVPEERSKEVNSEKLSLISELTGYPKEIITTRTMTDEELKSLNDSLNHEK